VSYFMFLYMSLNLACAEVTGIECGKQFGLYKKNNKDLQDNKIDQDEHELICDVIISNYNGALGKGFILTSMILCFSILMFLFAENILFAIDIAADNAYWTGYMVKF